MLPSEILIDEILPRLPAKSLVRFKCVSKHFELVISSPKFIALHLRHTISSNANRLLIVSQGVSAKHGLLTFDLDSPENPPTPLRLPNTFKQNPVNCIVGSCNGLVLIRGESSFSFLFLLINPSTGFCCSFVTFAPEYRYFNIYGIGYDARTGDYKVVGIDALNVLVVNLRNTIWHRIAYSDEVSLIDIIDKHKNAVVVNNHLCHWLYLCRSQKKHRIVCFNLCTETWTQDVPLPNYDEYDDDISLDSSFVLAIVSIFGTKNDVANLGVLDGFLTVCTQSTHHAGYNLWVMKEYGVVESWVKLFKFSDKVSVPLAYGRGSHSKAWVCELRNREGRLVWRSINRDKASIGNEIHDVHGVGPLFEACVAKGSLVAISVGE